MKIECRVPDCGAATNGFICKACLAETERAIADLPSLRYELSVLATRQTRIYRTAGPTDEQDREDAELDEEQMWRAQRIPAHLRSRDGRTALPATRMMVNLGARDLLAETDNLIVTWARHLVESRRAEWSRIVLGPGDSFVLTLRGEMPTTVGGMIAWLLTNIDTIRFDEAAADIHRQVTDVHRRIVRAVDRSPSRVYAGPCDAELAGQERCRRPLYAWPPPRFDSETERTRWLDDNPIVCDGYRPPFDRSGDYRPGDTGCGAPHTRADRRDWMLADLEDRLLPFTLLQDTLPGLLPELTWPSRSTWFRWRENRLTPHTVINGVEFFRGGDVIDLCQREQQRIKGNIERANRARGGRMSA